MTHDASPWTLVDCIGRLSIGPLAAEIDPVRPQLGLHSLQFDAAPQAGSRLQIAPSNDPGAWPAALVDCYVRGADLVASYAGTDHWPFHPTIYWTVDPISREGDVLASLSLVVSIQTSLLDTHPRLDVRSTLSANEVVLVSVVDDDLLVDSHGDGPQRLDPRASAAGLIWRLPGDALSYAEIMPASDLCQLTIDRTPSTIGSRWQLFAEFLEKGVIRRARLQSLYLPRENDVQLAAEACQSIERRPLPLTT